MKYLRDFSIFCAGLAFVVTSVLTIFLGSNALPLGTHFLRELIIPADTINRVQVMKACKFSTCRQWMAIRILADHPRQLEALGVLAISLCQLQQWDLAEDVFADYFAEGGRASDVQKWYQKLQGHQARNDAQ